GRTAPLPRAGRLLVHGLLRARRARREARRAGPAGDRARRRWRVPDDGPRASDGRERGDRGGDRRAAGRRARADRAVPEHGHEPQVEERAAPVRPARALPGARRGVLDARARPRPRGGALARRRSRGGGGARGDRRGDRLLAAHVVQEGGREDEPAALAAEGSDAIHRARDRPEVRARQGPRVGAIPVTLPNMHRLLAITSLLIAPNLLAAQQVDAAVASHIDSVFAAF